MQWLRCSMLFPSLISFFFFLLELTGKAVNNNKNSFFFFVCVYVCELTDHKHNHLFSVFFFLVLVWNREDTFERRQNKTQKKKRKRNREACFRRNCATNTHTHIHTNAHEKEALFSCCCLCVFCQLVRIISFRSVVEVHQSGVNLLAEVRFRSALFSAAEDDREMPCSVLFSSLSLHRGKKKRK